MTFLRYISLPFVPIYYVVTWLRNLFYDLGIKSSKSYGFPVICVGNLSVGGTGKTPMIEYLIALLKPKFFIATLSRGYGRKTKGFVLANASTKVEDIGDEPFQFYTKNLNSVVVSVDENRQRGISKLQALNPNPKVVLLDDAFQHRKVKAGLNILLTTYSNLYTSDWVLPTGNLREPRSGAHRAQIIVVTKCPTILSENEKQSIRKRIDPRSNQSLFFSSINYGSDAISKDATKPLVSFKNFTLVTGIANDKPLVEYLQSKKLEFNHMAYKDHYAFKAADIEQLSKQALILTTEKDYMRLNEYESLEGKLFYLPINLALDKPQNFNELIMNFVSP